MFSPGQALLASEVGADFVSTFIGRVDDAGLDGGAIVREIAELFEKRNIATQIIAASIRNSRRVVDAGTAGAHIATVPDKILMRIIEHPLTNIGLDRFLRDWRDAWPEKGVVTKHEVVEASAVREGFSRG